MEVNKMRYIKWLGKLLWRWEELKYKIKQKLKEE
jgi:hypothetical protein